MKPRTNSAIPFVLCVCMESRELPVADCGMPPVGTQVMCDCGRLWTLLDPKTTDGRAGEGRWVWEADDPPVRARRLTPLSSVPADESVSALVATVVAIYSASQPREAEEFHALAVTTVERRGAAERGASR